MPYTLSIIKYYYNIKNLTSCKTNAFHCLYVATVPVYHIHSVTNQVQACDVHHSCITCALCVCLVCSLASMHMPKLLAKVHMRAKCLSFTCAKCAATCMCKI